MPKFIYLPCVLILFLCAWGCSTALEPTKMENSTPASDPMVKENTVELPLAVQTPIPPNPMASISPKASQQTTPSVTPTPDFRPQNLEAFAGNIYCEPPDILPKPTLNRPFDLSVSPNGEQVFIMNKRCDTPVSSEPALLHTWLYEDNGCDEINRENRSRVQRQVVLVLKDQKLEHLSSLLPKSCTLSDEIEKDEQGRLYFTDLIHHQIFQWDGSQLNTLGPFREYQTSHDQVYVDGQLVSGGEFPIFGPTKLEAKDGTLFYGLRPNPFGNQAGFPLRALLLDDQINDQTLQKIENHIIATDWRTIALNKADHVIYYSLRNTIIAYNQRTQEAKPLTAFRLSETGSLDNNPRGYTDGPPSTAQFNGPFDLEFDEKRKLLFVADTGNHVIRTVTPDGHVSTYAGTGRAGFKNGQAQTAQFHFPTAIDLDDAGNLYVADMNNHAIRKIDPQGNVSTLYPVSSLPSNISDKK